MSSPATTKGEALARRFQAIQQKTQKRLEVAVELEHMSFDQLQNRTIRFGEAKLGQRYHEVVDSDPKYCKWFLNRWGNSDKPEHREFSYFLALWMERMEMNLGTAEANTIVDKCMTQGMVDGSSSPPVRAKAKAKAKMPTGAASEVSIESWENCAGIDEFQVLAERDYANQQRMDKLENVLTQVVQQLQQLSAQIPPAETK